jgi:putative FmdB family regulatory protein
MPIYEYACENCGGTLEQMQKVSDPAPETCPSCGAAGRLRRMISRTTFRLVGGGWYVDLYGSPRKDSGGTSGRDDSGA